YASGTLTPIRPKRAISRISSRGKISWRSLSRAPGASRSSANFRAVSRMAIWSSFSSKSIDRPSSLQQVGRDHDALDLARALVDLRDARISIIALHVEFLGVPVATVDLERLVRDPVAHLGGVELGHRGLGGVAHALVLERRRAEDEQARRIDVGGHVRQHESDGLVLGDGLAEALALLGVGERGLVGGAGD